MLFGKRKALGENVFQDKDKEIVGCEGENCEIKIRINQLRLDRKGLSKTPV